MSHFKLLHVWDDDDEGWGQKTFAGVKAADYKLPINGGMKALRKGLKKLMSVGHTFDAAIFLSHGRAGALTFSGEAWTIHDELFYDEMKIHRLFPSYGTIWFDGCNAGEGDAGTEFISKVGRKFLQRGGTVTACMKKMLANTGLLSYAMMAATGGFAASLLDQNYARGLPVYLPKGDAIFKVAIVTWGGHVPLVTELTHWPF